MVCIAAILCYLSPVPKDFPSRIVCLSAEATEIIFALGCGHRIVGVTSFAVEPPAVRRKPRVSGFSSVNFDKVDALAPDLVITFSDVQAEAAKELVRRGHTVLATNQRSLAEIHETILLLGRILGKPARAQKLAAKMRAEIFCRRARPRTRPKIYFEEWNDPLISGIRWVGELIHAAGGEDIFPELHACTRAPDRVVNSDEIIRRQPDIIIASWCGKKANLDAICRRPGWNGIPAVRNRRVHEIKSAHILQPGLSLLTGFRQLHEIINPKSALNR
jgi:iron complex transport system substrate-binding protein